MDKNLLIFGNSIMAEVVFSYFSKYSNYKKIIFCAEKKYIKKGNKFISNVLPIDEALKLNKKFHDVFIAIGYSKMNTVREKFVNFFLKKNFSVTNFIHPNNNIFLKNLGVNNFIMENVSINPYTKIGNNNFFWSSVVIGHHNLIGSNNFFSGNVTVSGNSRIKNNCFFGVNSCTKDGVIIDDYSFIDAGEYVTNNLKKFFFYNKKVNPSGSVKTSDFLF